MSLQISIDINDMTLGELEEIEETTGLAISALGNGTAKAMTALIWISERRNNPEFTLDDARKVRISEVEFGNPPE